MATIDSPKQEASSSLSPCSYHVFLSFRGADTRYTFTDHLYTELVREGFLVFRDDDEIERGKNIEAELERAIMESKISIVVISRDYGSSRWCLNELVRIMERQSHGHHVLPVFYHVDPSNVRKQTGNFEEAFVRHEKRFEKEKGRVQGWRAALEKAVDLGGMVLNDGYESEFIQHIVQQVRSKVRRKSVNVPNIMVGRESDLSLINSWIQDELDDVGIATISGMGGIGKTTVAKIVYNMNVGKFEGGSFLEDVRETSEQPNGLARLQRKLLSDLLKRKADKIYNVDEGIMEIKDVISNKKVLLVLDDVDHLDQFEAIIGMRKWLYPGSKIIITTRNECLLRGDEVNEMFKIEELNYKESVQLFCWYAFGQDHPKHGYERYSQSVVHHCNGLPLALKVLGSSLFDKTVDFWKEKLQKLTTIPDGEIVEVLKISYDSLKDDHDKSLFIDIACFFIGVDLNTAVKVLDGCDFYTRIGIENLMDRCLITITAENNLMMHQLIRDMGRDLVRQESVDEPGNRSRVWDDKDAVLVLRENKGTESIRGLSLKLSMLMEDKQGKSVPNTNSAKRHHDEDHASNLKLTHRGNSSKRRRLSFFSWKPVGNYPANTFSAKAFAKMQNLKLLKLYNVKLEGRYKDIPKSLVWLHWHGCSLSYIPRDCDLDKLVVLDMQHSNLTYVWKGVRFLGRLKILDLSHSLDLVRTPNFTGLPSLESLVLKDCIKLAEIDESIGYLTRLLSLNLEDCRSLKKIPVNINMSKSLEELNISGCLNLKELSQVLGNFESLKVLTANRIVFKDMRKPNPSWLRSALGFLQIPTRQAAKPTIFSLACLPSSLVRLSLVDCRLLDNVIPKDLSCFPSLKELDLSGNPFAQIPASIKSLTMLKHLVLRECTNLESVPQLPTSLYLDVTDCSSLKIIENNLDLVDSPYCVIRGCRKIVEVTCLFKLVPVEIVDRHVLNNMGLFDVESLESIEMELYNVYTGTIIKTKIQVLHEGGIYSIFLPKSEVPNCFSNRNKGDSVSFDVLPVHGYRLTGFSLCITHTLVDKGAQNSSTLAHKYYHVCIDNKTKGLKWKYEPAIRGIMKGSEDMLWLSYWQIGDFMKVEEGDQVHISVHMRGYDVKECSVRLIYDKEEDKVTGQSSSPWYKSYNKEKAAHILDHRRFIRSYDAFALKVLPISGRQAP